MKIAVISRKSTFYSTRRIIAAGRAKGHKVVFVDPLKCNVFLSENGLEIYYRKRKIPRCDFAITRIGNSLTHYGLSVVRQFEMMGVKVINCSEGILNAKDKMRSLQLLKMNNIDVPKTVITRNPKNIYGAVKMVGGVPVILKPLYGAQGLGVILAESLEAVESIIGTLWGLEQNILIQQYISESKGKDIRALVIGGKVVAAMRRIAEPDKLCANIHRGGRGEKLELSAEGKKLAVKAAKIINLDIAGVDMLETKNGPLLMEVNASPGFEALEKVTGEKIAEQIIDYGISAVEKSCG